MKHLLYLLCISLSLSRCTGNKQPEFSLPNTQIASNPAPVLDPVEARRYHALISDFVDKHLSERNFNGGILVAKRGVIVYERYSGYENMQTKTPMTATSSLQVASTGKTLTSAAILKLIQEEKMALNDPVTKFIPEFPYTDITVKMMLNHRSGLPNYLYYMESLGWNKKITATNEDVINTLIQWKPAPMFRADTRFTYCNTNYVILASIIERVSGVSYPEYMKENFFKPLGMENTFVKTQADSASVLYSYQGNGSFWRPDFTDGPYGDKNIYSTPQDLLKWDQALYTESIIHQPLLDSAFTPYSNEKPGVKNYGLGWHLLILPHNKKVIFHNGRWHGFNAVFARLTDEEITIIMTDNKLNMGVYGTAKKMYNLFGSYSGEKDDSTED